MTRRSLLRVMDVQNLVYCEKLYSTDAGKVSAFTSTYLPGGTFFLISWQRVIQKRTTCSRFLDPATNLIYAPSLKQASNDYPANFVALESSFPGKMRCTVSRGSSRCRENDIPVRKEDKSTGITFDIFNEPNFHRNSILDYQLSPRNDVELFLSTLSSIVKPIWRGALPAVWYTLKKNGRSIFSPENCFPLSRRIYIPFPGQFSENVY